MGSLKLPYLVERGKGMRVGVSSIRITPPAGVVLEGYACRKGVAIGIHDDLFVSCVTFEAKNDVFSFLSFDLIGIPNCIVPSLQKIVSDALGITEDHILLAATHTHSGPAVLGLQEGNELNKLWLEILPKYVETSAKQSTYNMRKCHLKVGSTEEKFVGKNRRKPGGITDPTLTILSFIDDETDELKAMMVNYACHATILDNTNLLITSDYIHWVRETIKKYHPGVTVLFFNGAEGDVNIGYSAERSLMGEPVQIERNFKMAEKMGKIVGFDALSVFEKAGKVEDHGKSSSKMVKIEVPVRKGRSVGELKRLINSCDDDLEKFFLEQELEVVRNFPDRVVLPLQLIRLPSLTMFCLPVEPFTKIGLELRKMSQTPENMVVGLANGWYGYLPTPDEFDLGGYETKLGPWSYLDENTSELILKTFKEMIEEIET